MKYGVISYRYGGEVFLNSVDKYHINIGDNMQSFAIENLYKKMGIPEEKIVRIYYDELKSYKGEYVILPMNMYGSKDDILPLSPYLIPVFVGFNYVTSQCYDKKDYLKSYEPIGCRDEYTLNLMREAGIKSYLSGCITICLDRRVSEPKKKKVFFVDTPEILDKYIPEEIKKYSEFLSHEIEIDTPLLESDKTEKIDNYAKSIMNRYKNEATLVVTSRLHCAAPCIAMGIPVIIVKENVDINMSWIDKFIKIYSKDEFDNIDWNAKSIEIEDAKNEMIRVFSKQIRKCIADNDELLNLSAFYENRDRSCYNNTLTQKFKAKCEKLIDIKDKEVRFAIWGAGAGGTLAYQIIKENLPNSKLVLIVDTYQKGTFFGVDIKSPNELDNKDFDFLFLCTYSGREEAIKKVNEISLDNDRYMFLISRVINKKKTISSEIINRILSGDCK